VKTVVGKGYSVFPFPPFPSGAMAVSVMIVLYTESRGVGSLFASAW